MNHVISASQHWPRPLVKFILRHHVVEVTSSVFNSRCRRRERFLVGGAAPAGRSASRRLYSRAASWCGKTQIVYMYRSRQSCHRSRVEFGRPAWYATREGPKRQKLTYVEYFVRVLCNIPQLLYDAIILCSITIAYIIHYIVFSRAYEYRWWWSSHARGRPANIEKSKSKTWAFVHATREEQRGKTSLRSVPNGKGDHPWKFSKN